MRYLLDTHSLIWFLEDDINLSYKAKSEITNLENQCFVSIVSLWEIFVKINIGKLKLDFPVSVLKKEIQNNSFEILPIAFEHLQQLLQLDFHHKDPFDRLIIAQAQSEKMVVITKDGNFNEYNNVKLLW